MQKSVFEIVLRETDKLHLVARLNSTIDHKLDSVRLYRLPHRSLDDVERLGKARDTEPRGPLII